MTIVVLFNLLVPVGWRVGLLRVEDVAIGCAVSLVVGVLFWPRGASSVVAEDLADSFRLGGEYLKQAVDWALSELLVPPAAAVATVSASIRLEDAVRGFLAEQGSKKLTKDDLWMMLNAATRLRLTANSLAGLRQPESAPGMPPGAACVPLAGSEEYAGAPACVTLRSAAAGLAGFYDQIADEVGRPPRSGEPVLIPAPAMLGPAVPRPGATPGDVPARSGAAAAASAAPSGNGAGPEGRRGAREGHGSPQRHSACAATAAPAPAVGAGAPAPPEPERANGQRARAADSGTTPPALVAVTEQPTGEPTFHLPRRGRHRGSRPQPPRRQLHAQDNEDFFLRVKKSNDTFENSSG